VRESTLATTSGTSIGSFVRTRRLAEDEEFDEEEQNQGESQLAEKKTRGERS